MTTTTPAGTLRELAIAAAERRDREQTARFQEIEREYREYLLSEAAEHARQVFGGRADGAVWELVERAEDEPGYDDRATATIDGERFLFADRRGSFGYGYLYHLLPCPSPLHPPAEMQSPSLNPREPGQSTLEVLGEVLRAAPNGYTCERCAALKAADAALAAAASAAKAAAELRETLEGREQPRDAEIALAARVRAAAAESQAWSAIARTIQQVGESA